MGAVFGEFAEIDGELDGGRLRLTTYVDRCRFALRS